jgi:shikimate dehydrogenase
VTLPDARLLRYRLGLLGHDISYSRSPALFDAIFRREGLEDGSSYTLFDRSDPEAFLREVREGDLLEGFNVTTPYKTIVLPFLDRIDPSAAAVGAVNCVVVQDHRLLGYNTDVEGFAKALTEEMPPERIGKALILGSGGAAQAVRQALTELEIPSEVVSRSRGLTYDRLTTEELVKADLIVNATPLGSQKFPGEKPPIDYDRLRPEQWLFDLTYDPEETPFLAEGRRRGCRTTNGLSMLLYQAEASWRHFRRGGDTP